MFPFLRLTSLVLLVALLPVTGSSQERQRDRRSVQGFQPDRSQPILIESSAPSAETAQHREVFDAVQLGVEGANVSTFAKYLGPQLNLNIRGGESGYYSANQAFYVLQNYLAGRRPLSFQFTTFGESGAVPYATGAARFEFRGGVDVVQIYVALAKIQARWVISQINIY